MEQWAALLTPPPQAIPSTDVHCLAVWALQFTPKVAHLDEAVVLELAASMRLFGGEEALRARVTDEAIQLGVHAVAWAPTSLAALAFARSGVTDGFAAPLHQLLDRIPLESVTAVAKHHPILARLGCRTLVGVRRFPRNLSQHTGGFVLTKGPLSRIVPIENASMAGRRSKELPRR